MIRINLLPVREARRQAGLRNQGILLGVAAGIGVLACVGLQLSIKSRIASSQRAIGQKQAELAALDETRKQVEQFQREREEIEQKLNIIAALERQRSGPVRLMDEIATRIPKRLWLQRLEANQGELQLAGWSLDAEIVAAFLTSLEESPMISNVVLLETTLEEQEGLKLSSFKLKSRFPYTPPPPVTGTGAKAGKAGGH